MENSSSLKRKIESLEQEETGEFDDLDDLPDNLSEEEEFKEEYREEFDSDFLDQFNEVNNEELIEQISDKHLSIEECENREEQTATTGISQDFENVSFTPSCPICGIIVSDDLNLHVNSCLDTKSKDKPEKRSKQASILSFFQKSNSASSQTTTTYQLPPKSKEVDNDTLVAFKNAFQPSKDAPKIVPKNQSGPVSWSDKSRKCPYYKLLPGTPIAVDAFSYGTIPGVTHFFLSHYHSDHYGGLNRSFGGTIYTSNVTKRLVVALLGVNPDRIVGMDVWDTIELEFEKCTVKVTAYDANHCPGSLIFLFKINHLHSTRVHLHTGDFRFHPGMLKLPLDNLDSLYLDTTYARPQYQFPPQGDVIQAVCDLLRQISTKDGKMIHPNSLQTSKKNSLLSWITPKVKETKTLVCVGSYQIGKERIFTSIANTLSTKVFVGNHKRRVLGMIQDSTLTELLTDDVQARVHVVGMGTLAKGELEKYLESVRKKGVIVSRLIAIRPTGWTWKGPVDKLPILQPSSDIVVIPVPYSEHSSYAELETFVTSLAKRGLKKVIPTVPSKDWKETQKIVNSWLETSRQV